MRRHRRHSRSSSSISACRPCSRGRSTVIEYAGARGAARSRRTEAVDASLAGRLDWLLVAAVAGLVGYGLYAIAGITRHDVPGNSDYYLVRQGVFAGVGVVGLVGALLVDPDVYRRSWRVIYGGTIAFMLLVFLAGPLTRGTKRWVDVG